MPADTSAVALALMVFFALCSQCMATLGTIRRETHSWRWPLFTFAYMSGIAWVAAVLAYQAMYIIADAVERAGSTDPAAIRDALAETNYADHILPYSGPITFDDTGENEVAKPVVMQVQDGAVSQVWPTDLAESEPIFPCVSWGE